MDQLPRRPRSARVLAVVLSCVACWWPAPAHAAAGEDDGMLRLAHLSPDTPAGDVYVDSVTDPDVRLSFPGVAYGMVSEYQDVPPGTYAISMRSLGAAPTSPPILSATVEVTPGSARTVAGLGYFADLGLEVLDDELALPSAGQARARVINAAADAPRLDVSLHDGPPVATDLGFATASGYVDVPGGPAALTVDARDGSPVRLPVELAAGSVYTVLVLDDPDGGVTVRTVLDAASPAVVPVGGVETGAGGAAGGTGPVRVALAVAAAAVLGLAVHLRERLPRHGRGRPPAARS